MPEKYGSIAPEKKKNLELEDGKIFATTAKNLISAYWTEYNSLLYLTSKSGH